MTQPLTEQQLLAAKLLSPDHQASYKQQVQEIEQEICNLKFSGDPHLLQEQIYQITFLQGRRAALLDLLEDSAEAFTNLSNQE